MGNAPIPTEPLPHQRNQYEECVKRWARSATCFADLANDLHKVHDVGEAAWGMPESPEWHRLALFSLARAATMDPENEYLSLIAARNLQYYFQFNQGEVSGPDPLISEDLHLFQDLFSLLAAKPKTEEELEKEVEGYYDEYGYDDFEKTYQLIRAELNGEPDPWPDRRPDIAKVVEAIGNLKEVLEPLWRDLVLDVTTEEQKEDPSDNVP